MPNFMFFGKNPPVFPFCGKKREFGFGSKGGIGFLFSKVPGLGEKKEIWGAKMMIKEENVFFFSHKMCAFAIKCGRFCHKIRGFAIKCVGLL